MKTIEVLQSGKFTSMRKVVDKEQGINGYEFLHEDRCDGHIVSILPYRYVDSIDRRDNPYDFLLRYEMTPCWSTEDNVWSSITGGVDKGHDHYETAIIELEEEAGYRVDIEDLVYLGTCFGTKSSDTLYHLFTVDLTGLDAGEAVGDGSYLEDQAHCEWVEDLDEAEDPLVFTSYYLGRKEGLFF